MSHSEHLSHGGSLPTGDEAVPTAGSDRRKPRRVELWWQPVGEPRPPGVDGRERRWRVPEVHVTDHAAARAFSFVLALVVAVGAVFWIFEAADRFGVPALVCAGCAPPGWFRWLQLLGAVAGIVVAMVQIVYFVNFAVRGVVWRRWRGVAIAFGALTVAWTAMWWIDFLWI